MAGGRKVFYTVGGKGLKPETNFKNVAPGKFTNAYNHQRPHSSCNMLTPAKAHLERGMLKKRWKTYQRNTGKTGRKEAGTALITEQEPASFLPDGSVNNISKESGAVQDKQDKSKNCLPFTGLKI